MTQSCQKTLKNLLDAMSDSFLRALVYFLCLLARWPYGGYFSFRLDRLDVDFDVAHLRGSVCEKRIIICPLNVP
jgi:hypothetical protein